MNTLKDVIGMGGGLFEEAYNIGRREALRETGAEDLQATVTALEAANKVLGEKLEKAQARIEELEKTWDENETLRAKVASYDGVSREQAKEVNRLKGKVKELNDALAIYRVPTPRACPFCGGPAEVHQLHKDEWYVVCGNSDCPVNPETNTFDTEAEAIEAWNNSYNAPQVTCDWR